MKTLHISAECYPAAKAGGLGDVVGALPKYLNTEGVPSAVVIPKYDLPWIRSRSSNVVHSGAFQMQNGYFYPFAIEQVADDSLGYPLFLVNLPGQFDRQGIYSDMHGWFGDNEERFVYFQQAVLHWLLHMEDKPDILHCHDHHSGLIPFLIQNSPTYQSLSYMPTVFTIHNGEYHGSFTWDKFHLLPPVYAESRSLLDWGNVINPLACAIKCAWAVTTVSESYLEELSWNASGLEGLLRSVRGKSRGILNGIDAQTWDPATDPYLPHHLAEGDINRFKSQSKQSLQERFSFNADYPVVTFIGRLVREKGADLLPDLIPRVLNSGLGVSFLILGTGEPSLHDALRGLKNWFPGRFDAVLEYNEGLAHLLYAGSDFLIMPSRVEPCGLNQMYAMRYGTIPIVRSVGGLRDTVIDVGEPGGNGRGIRFDHFSVDDGHHAIWRAYELFHNQPYFHAVRERIMGVDFSWENAAHNYISLYRELRP